jgi:hypothetical protein
LELAGYKIGYLRLFLLKDLVKAHFAQARNLKLLSAHVGITLWQGGLSTVNAKTAFPSL